MKSTPSQFITDLPQELSADVSSSEITFDGSTMHKSKAGLEGTRPLSESPRDSYHAKTKVK